jgi:hypothetical protein
MSIASTLPNALTPLADGPLYHFADWPNGAVPKFGAGAYTIWRGDGRFINAGMSGRSIKADTSAPGRPYGIYTRLHSHASGRRSGDQFCVYVADRLVLPTLTREEIDQIASGRHRLALMQHRLRLTSSSRTTAPWRPLMS